MKDIWALWLERIVNEVVVVVVCKYIYLVAFSVILAQAQEGKKGIQFAESKI